MSVKVKAHTDIMSVRLDMASNMFNSYISFRLQRMEDCG